MLIVDFFLPVKGKKHHGEGRCDADNEIDGFITVIERFLVYRLQLIASTINRSEIVCFG